MLTIYTLTICNISYYPLAELFALITTAAYGLLYFNSFYLRFSHALDRFSICLVLAKVDTFINDKKCVNFCQDKTPPTDFIIAPQK